MNVLLRSSALLLAGSLASQNDGIRILQASGLVESVDWSRDGSTLAVLADQTPDRGAPRAIEIWDLATGKRMATVGRSTEPSSAARLSPDGETVACARWWRPGLLPAALSKPPASRPSQLTAWRLGDARRVQALDGAEVTGLGVSAASADMLCLRFSPDGRFVAAGGKLVDRSIIEGGHIGGALVVWDLQKGGVAWGDHTTHTDIVQSVAFSPDGTLLASGGSDKLIRLWNARTGELRHTLVGATWNGVSALAFSRDGKLLASGGSGPEEGGMVRVWSLDTRRIEHTVPSNRTGFAHDNVRLTFSADGGEIYAVGRAAKEGPAAWRVVAIDAATGEVLQPLLAPRAGFARAIEASPDGKWLAIGTATGEVVVLPLGQK